MTLLIPIIILIITILIITIVRFGMNCQNSSNNNKNDSNRKNNQVRNSAINGKKLFHSVTTNNITNHIINDTLVVRTIMTIMTISPAEHPSALQELGSDSDNGGEPHVSISPLLQVSKSTPSSSSLNPWTR